jgi:hypothetical protein
MPLLAGLRRGQALVVLMPQGLLAAALALVWTPLLQARQVLLLLLLLPCLAGAAPTSVAVPLLPEPLLPVPLPPVRLLSPVLLLLLLLFPPPVLLLPLVLLLPVPLPVQQQLQEQE